MSFGYVIAQGKKGIDDIVSTFGTSNPDSLRDESPFGMLCHAIFEPIIVHQRLDTPPPHIHMIRTASIHPYIRLVARSADLGGAIFFLKWKEGEGAVD